MNPRHITVTPAQRAIIGELAGDGAPSRDIADRLGLSPRAVDEHIVHVLRRAGMHSRLELVVALLRGRLKVRTADRRREPQTTAGPAAGAGR